VSIIINNVWWWILAAVVSFTATWLFGKWCSKGATEADEVMVNTQVEALGGGDLYYRLRHDKWFGVFCMSIFYLFLWPLIDFIYILLAPNMLRGRRDRLAS
jgi:hypothetical protein